jgi:REP element-mobilizing transposase RayT
LAQRIKQLAAIFTIDIAAYSIMHNHYHIVVRVDNERVAEMSTQGVIRRWSQLYSGPMIIRRYLSDQREQMSQGELLQVDKLADSYRERLCDLSWFMKNLNEFIARKANAEDDVRGHFWESRYKCQALLDEQALLTAMAYVDLNPIRAAIAETPEQSDYTSVKHRVDEIDQQSVVPTYSAVAASEPQERQAQKGPLPILPVALLLPFDPTESFLTSIPFAFEDYLELVDTVGRVVHPGKRGTIPKTTPAILQRLGINLASFIEHSDQFLKRFGNNVGMPAKLIDLAAARNVRYLRGIAKSRALFAADVA